MAEKAHFDGLNRHRGKREQGAKRYPPQQRDGFSDSSGRGPDFVRRIDPIWHAISFKEKELCAKPARIDNINCEKSQKKKVFSRDAITALVRSRRLDHTASV